MLDQNTDRMWYVIGAVLIGAAIIFGMNTLMPNTFASVGSMMSDVLDNVGGVGWTEIPIETFESEREKPIGGIGYIDKNNLIKYEESGSIAIEESPYFGSGMGITPGHGK